MQFAKKFARGLTSVAFIFLLFTTATTTAVIMTFNSPKKIEKSLSDSGVYSTFISGALNEAKKANQNDKSTSDNSDLPTDNPAVVQAANKAFTPELLQTTTENVLDGTYSWLSGKTAAPSFAIDLTAAKKTFAQGVGEAAKKQMLSLPVCTVSQLRAMGMGADFDPFKATCRPPGINVNAEQLKITNDIANNKDFLSTPVITPQTLPKNDNGKTIFEQAAQAPKIYKWVNASPWLLATLALITGVITFFLYDSKRRGARNLAIATTVVGAILVLSFIASDRAFRSLSQPHGQIAEAVKGSFQQTIIRALNSITHAMEHIILWFGAAYLILGIGTLVILHFIKPKESKTDSPEKTDDKPKDPSPPVDDSPKQPEPKPEIKPSPKPKSVHG